MRRRRADPWAGRCGAAGACALLGAVVAAPLAPPAAATDAVADAGFLERYAQTYRFTLGHPASITVTPEGRAVFFLRSGPRSFVRDLWMLEPETGRERVLLTAEQILRGAEERLTAEERAKRERKRLAARGIASYQLSRDGGRLLVPLAGRLFVVEWRTGRITELTRAAAPPDDPRLSPDGGRVACVRDGDLYVMDVTSGTERRLTRRESDTVTHGLAEFVAQEEMGRFEGFWWSPDSRWIAYQRTDTREVERLAIADPAHPERAPESWPYPRPGKTNADVRLGVIAADGSPTTWVSWDRARYPYLAKVTWEESAPLTILVQNREQTEEALLRVDPATGATRALLVERDPAWINLDPGMPRWFEDGSHFLWTTERRGARELELRGRDGRLLRVIAGAAIGFRSLADLDDRRGIAWVAASPVPTERHLYRVPLDPRKERAVPLTGEPGLHMATFAREHGVYVLESSTLAGKRRFEVWSTDGGLLGVLRSVAEEPPFLPNLELTTVGRSPPFHAAVIRPRDFGPGGRYPVLVHVYGGPLSQMVLADRRRYLLDQWFADQGFVVVALDGRGTPAQGRAWERAIKGDFISIPLADQVAGLRALAAKHPELDLSRVGIWGWSFGGYFAVMAVMRRPDVFHAAAAGAPVVDWLDYDTHYTERYLGVPPARAAAYEMSSVLAYAKDLARPLLVVHGTADDNVYFLHSLKLCDALNRAGKPYEFMPMVGYTHMVSAPLTTVRLQSRILQHFRRALGTVPAPVTTSGAR